MRRKLLVGCTLFLFLMLSIPASTAKENKKSDWSLLWDYVQGLGYVPFSYPNSTASVGTLLKVKKRTEEEWLTKPFACFPTLTNFVEKGEDRPAPKHQLKEENKVTVGFAIGGGLTKVGVEVQTDQISTGVVELVPPYLSVTRLDLSRINQDLSGWENMAKHDPDCADMIGNKRTYLVYETIAIKGKLIYQFFNSNGTKITLSLAKAIQDKFPPIVKEHSNVTPNGEIVLELGLLLGYKGATFKHMNVKSSIDPRLPIGTLPEGPPPQGGEVYFFRANSSNAIINQQGGPRFSRWP